MSQSKPAPSPSQPTPPQPNRRDKYVKTIIAVAVIALLVGIGLGYGLGILAQSRQGFTLVEGRIDAGTEFLDGWIYFDNQNNGQTLSSAIVPVTPHGYAVYLESGQPYSVTIYYQNSTGPVHSCAGKPSQFIPYGSFYIQSLQC